MTGKGGGELSPGNWNQPVNAGTRTPPAKRVQQPVEAKAAKKTAA